jgi:hypothetical protein
MVESKGGLKNEAVQSMGELISILLLLGAIATIEDALIFNAYLRSRGNAGHSALPPHKTP